MAQTYFPFGTGAGANVMEDQWRKMARLWLPTGVMASELNKLLVYADSSGMQVKVKSGRAWMRGHFFENDAEYIAPIGAADPTNPRIDRVVVSADFVADTTGLGVLQGTPAATPVAPSLTQTEDVLWQISLAQVAVGATVTTIAAANVTDERPMHLPGLGTQVGVLTSNQNKTNMTLAAIPEMGFWAEASAIYVLDVTVFYEAPTGGDIKLGWGTPAGSTGAWGGLGPQLSAGSGETDKIKQLATSSIGNALSFGGLDVSRTDVIRLWGVIHTSTTSGLIQLKFAQDTTSGTTQVHPDSVLVARRIA